MYVILGLLLFNDLLWVLDCFHNAYLLFDFYLLYSVDEWGVTQDMTNAKNNIKFTLQSVPLPLVYSFSLKNKHVHGYCFSTCKI